MKDATSELSMTAIAVVAIAAIAVVFTTLIWPTIQQNIKRSAHCSQTISCDCKSGDKLCTCTYLDESDEPQTVQCQNPDYKAGGDTPAVTQSNG